MLRILLVLCVSVRCASALAAPRFVAVPPSGQSMANIPVDWSGPRVVPESEEKGAPGSDVASLLCRAQGVLGAPQPFLFDDLRFDLRDELTGAQLALRVDWEYGGLKLQALDHPQRGTAAQALLDVIATAPPVDCELTSAELAEARVYRMKQGVSSSRDATHAELLALQLRRVARLDDVDDKGYREWTDQRWRIDDIALHAWVSTLSPGERSRHLEAVAPLRRAARRFLGRPGAVGMSGLGRSATCSYLQRLTRTLPPETASDRSLWATTTASACRREKPGR